MVTHGFSSIPRQQMKVRRPSGLSAARMFVKAAVGSAKNMIP